MYIIAFVITCTNYQWLSLLFVCVSDMDVMVTNVYLYKINNTQEELYTFQAGSSPITPTMTYIVSDGDLQYKILHMIDIQNVMTDAQCMRRITRRFAPSRGFTRITQEAFGAADCLKDVGMVATHCAVMVWVGCACIAVCIVACFIGFWGRVFWWKWIPTWLVFALFGKVLFL